MTGERILPQTGKINLFLRFILYYSTAQNSNKGDVNMHRSKSKSIIFALSLLLGCSLGEKGAVADCCDGSMECLRSDGTSFSPRYLLRVGYTSIGHGLCCQPVPPNMTALRQICTDAESKGEFHCNGSCEAKLLTSGWGLFDCGKAGCTKSTRTNNSSGVEKKPSKGSPRK